MSSSSLRLVLLMLAFSSVSVGATGADKHFLKVHFTVKDDSTKRVLDQAVISVSNSDGASYAHQTKFGKAEMQFELGEFVYDVKFASAGYVPKVLRFDTRNIPHEDKTGGFDIVIDISLFRYRPGFNLEMMQAPCGLSRYDTTTHDLMWDIPLTQQKREEIKRELVRWNASSLRFPFEKFDEAFYSGTKHQEQKQWLYALVQFENALALLPDEPMATEKIQACKAAIHEQIDTYASELRTQELLQLADEYMMTKHYDFAKKAFQAASKLEPQNKYPKERLFEIDQLQKYSMPAKP